MTKQDWSYCVEMSLNGKVLRSKKNKCRCRSLNIELTCVSKKYQTNAAGKHLLKLVLFPSINLQGNIWSFIEEAPIWEGVCGRRLFHKKRNCANPSLGDLSKKATPIWGVCGRRLFGKKKELRKPTLGGLSKKATPIWEGVCGRRLFHNFGNAVFAQNELFQNVSKVRLSKISTRPRLFESRLK